MLAITDLDASQDGTPRILDLRLAELLGFARPRAIREIIFRHHHELERFGEIRRAVRRNPGTIGRPVDGYVLNRKQALYLCAKSETPRAAEVTIQMVEVFDQFLGLRDEAKTVKVREHWRRPPSASPEDFAPPAFNVLVSPTSPGWARVEAAVPQYVAMQMLVAAARHAVSQISAQGAAP